MSENTAARPAKRHNPVYRAIDSWFRLTERGTNIKTEIFAGILMFLEVACMAAVSAELILSSTSQLKTTYTTVYFAIMLASVIGTVLMAVLCNAPLIQSMSMGAVVLIASVLSENIGIKLSNILLIALCSNLIYLIVMVIPPVRRFIFRAVPDQVRKALPAAVGAYLLVFVLSQYNIIQVDAFNFSAVLEKMAAAGDALKWWGMNTFSLSLDGASELGWYFTASICTTVIGFMVVSLLQAWKRKHAVMIGLVVTLLIYLAMFAIRGNFMEYYYYAFITPSYGGMYFYDSVPRIANEFQSTMFLKPVTETAELLSAAEEETSAVNAVFSLYLKAQEAYIKAGKVEAFDTAAKLISIIATTGISFLVMGVTDTAAGLHGSAYASGACDEKGEPVCLSNPHFGRVGRVINVYSVNALSSVICCVLGCGPVSVRPESIVGGREGGKTGLAAIVSALLCVAGLYTVAFSGLFMNGIVVWGILVFVALSQFRSFENCRFDDPTDATVFLLTVAVTALTQNIGTAILLGIVFNTVIKLLSGRVRELNAGSYVMAVVSAALLVVPMIL